MQHKADELVKIVSTEFEKVGRKLNALQPEGMPKFGPYVFVFLATDVMVLACQLLSRLSQLIVFPIFLFFVMRSWGLMRFIESQQGVKMLAPSQIPDFEFLVNKNVYSPFGEITTLGGTSVGFTGQRYDPETGLYYFKMRYYSPKLGRFLQADPSGYTGTDHNLYTYVKNSPLKYVDPLGLDDEMPHLPPGDPNDPLEKFLELVDKAGKKISKWSDQFEVKERAGARAYFLPILRTAGFFLLFLAVYVIYLALVKLPGMHWVGGFAPPLGGWGIVPYYPDEETQIALLTPTGYWVDDVTNAPVSA